MAWSFILAYAALDTVLIIWQRSTPEDKVKGDVVPMTACSRAQGFSRGRLSGVTAEVVKVAAPGLFSTAAQCQNARQPGLTA